MPLTEINRFLLKLGFLAQPQWTPITYNLEVVGQNPQMVNFERPYAGFFPPFQQVKAAGSLTQVYLSVQVANDASSKADLVLISPTGGYIAEGFGYYVDYGDVEAEEQEFREWFINPFHFFHLAFKTDDLPAPDATTLAGERIFYSHIDGDGWNNTTLIEGYVEDSLLSTEVILREVFEPYPDMPVTLGPIVADIHPDWAGKPRSEELFSLIFALPHVEAGCHTYSHPFAWEFFQDGNITKEEPFLHMYPEGRWDLDPNASWFDKLIADTYDFFAGEDTDKLDDTYDRPRAYANLPFDSRLEVKGAVDYLNSLLPPSKRVECYMWSGNTAPWGELIEITEEIGIGNINGGDSRYDQEFPSLAWVAPLSVQVDGKRQIYASNSNENTYTDLWTDRYYGFQHLRRTIENTESPLRLKPFNVYYHLYSGERQASLSAVTANLDYARKSEIIPITTSHFIKVVEGYYSSIITQNNDGAWTIRDRKSMQTLRFDHAILKGVDFSRSKGVVGQRHYQGSLYIYLDQAVDSAQLALKDLTVFYEEPEEEAFYLVRGRWSVWDVQRQKNAVSFQTKGFGAGEMVWQVPRHGKYRVEITLPDGSVRSYPYITQNTDEGRWLEFAVHGPTDQPIKVTLTHQHV